MFSSVASTESTLMITSPCANFLLLYAGPPKMRSSTVVPCTMMPTCDSRLNNVIKENSAKELLSLANKNRKHR